MLTSSPRSPGRKLVPAVHLLRPSAAGSPPAARRVLCPLPPHTPRLGGGRTELPSNSHPGFTESSVTSFLDLNPPPTPTEALVGACPFLALGNRRNHRGAPARATSVPSTSPSQREGRPSPGRDQTARGPGLRRRSRSRRVRGRDVLAASLLTGFRGDFPGRIHGPWSCKLGGQASEFQFLEGLGTEEDCAVEPPSLQLPGGGRPVNLQPLPSGPGAFAVEAQQSSAPVTPWHRLVCVSWMATPPPRLEVTLPTPGMVTSRGDGRCTSTLPARGTRLFRDNDLN